MAKITLRVYGQNRLQLYGYPLGIYHDQCAYHYQNKANASFFRQLLMKYKIGECNRDKNTEFIDRNYYAGRSVLQRFVIAKPRTPGGQS